MQLDMQEVIKLAKAYKWSDEPLLSPRECATILFYLGPPYWHNIQRLLEEGVRTRREIADALEELLWEVF